MDLRKELTGREQETLVYLLMGFETSTIATKMEIGVDTVRPMVHSIYRWYDVHSRGELMAMFVSKELLQVEVEVMLDRDFERPRVGKK
tara:strand:+ start:1230 stop:1493 length:264 start_codon:yes stop_codon:yes gene_type:complete